MITRRQALVLAAGVTATKVLGQGNASNEQAVSPQPLRWHAARKGLSFGLCVLDDQIVKGGALTDLVVRESDMIVAVNALKWGQLEKVLGKPDFSAAERAVAFAARNNLKFRGHTAFWYRNIPPEIQSTLSAPETRGKFLQHVSEVVAHFRGRIVEWDVMNEVIEPHDKMPGLLRKLPFGTMDYGYLAELFAAAHAADPSARLYYNDYALEGILPYEQEKRSAALTLLTELKKRGAPVHGLGVQSHIATHLPFSASVFRKFLGEVAAMGLEIRLTEFDVSDRVYGPGTIPERDKRMADLARRYLDAAFDERAVKGLLCWGVEDRESFYNEPNCKECRRPDGSTQRPLPFDDNLKRKPLWYAIARAIDGAPNR